MQTQQMKLIVKVVLAVLVVILLVANHELLSTRVTLSFFGIGGAVALHNFWLLLAAFVLGAIVWPMFKRALFRRKQ